MSRSPGFCCTYLGHFQLFHTVSQFCTNDTSPQRLQEIGFLKRSRVHLRSIAAKCNFKPTKISLPKAGVSFEAAYKKPCRWFIWDSTVIIFWWLKTQHSLQNISNVFLGSNPFSCVQRGKQTNQQQQQTQCLLDFVAINNSSLTTESRLDPTPG